MWAVFALMTVLTWGLYGAFLNKGAVGFDHDRMKAFLFVGVAYFLIAVLGPLILIAVNGKEPKWEFKPEGIKLSLFAGSLGAIGALTVLIALNTHPLTAEKQPAMAASQVMSLVFAGAPIVAAIYGIVTRKAQGELNLDWRFITGLVLAASGGAMVTIFKP
jgi:drug/metabolite transporter (DMT)-like permease